MAHSENDTRNASLAEKDGGIDQVESVPVFANLSVEDAQWLADFPEELKKAVVKKVRSVPTEFWDTRITLFQVDIRLIPLLTLLYLFSFIDRANIGKQCVELYLLIDIDQQ